MENTELIAWLRAHVAALETELARYAHRYGMSDEARRLLKGTDSQRGAYHGQKPN